MFFNTHFDHLTPILITIVMFFYRISLEILYYRTRNFS